MREIIFDTETTGLDSREDRIIEIGGIELDNSFPTGRTIHIYINPGDRKVHPDALAVHGITDEFLADKPRFEAVAEEIITFFGDARWVAHNATFDMGFINAEFARLGIAPIAQDRVLDTLAMARRKFPKGPNSLDALCRRFGIDNSHRAKHGALLDSELLAEVYIEMIGGRQAGLSLVSNTARKAAAAKGDTEDLGMLPPRPTPLAPRLGEEERAAHAAMVAKMGEKAIWRKFGSDD